MRRRARDLGLRLGRYQPGPFNAITDVKGVRVGHSTIIRGEGALKVGEGPIRTGVTAIHPHAGDVYVDRVAAGGFVLNGAGEMSGLTQVMEWGLAETPILLTNTLSMGTAAAACVKYLVQKHPGIGFETDVVLPLVGECDDSWLNDIAGGHVLEKNVFEAIESAKSGPVEEGCVGGGTGMVTCDFKAGIGTSSRRLPEDEGGYTVGVLVMSNFGRMEDLRFDGVPIGQMLAPKYRQVEKRASIYGSIISIFATDAPLWSYQISRIAKRVALGIGRVGSYAAHGSGEIVMGFSTANHIPRNYPERTIKMEVLLDERLDSLYSATIETTEEAILNALCMAEPMRGVNGHYSPAIPLDEVEAILSKYRQVIS